ncbi:hypothetical protein EYZ11_008594 [Aspergillus tanneri]|uniref:Uncharacterized protein n=1 Tax=Aspergillus tanneri TaxID=1220188 RepID=A0A4S3JA25_9EURO|nr:hypothetical protein EYZ11_008594 [Aspergillus tanneri]
MVGTPTWSRRLLLDEETVAEDGEPVDEQLVRDTERQSKTVALLLPPPVRTMVLDCLCPWTRDVRGPEWPH